MGSIALVCSAISGTGAALVGFWSPTMGRLLQRLAVGCVAIAVLAAGWLLAVEDTSYELVVDHTRPGLSIVRRVMGLWGGSSGSLLLFTLIVGAVLSVAPVPAARRLVASGTIAVLAWTLVVISQPFERVGNEPIAGSGLSPILEHWAMIIHPPLLYLGLALSLVPALAPRASRTWTVAAVAVLTIALALGGFWAYEEVGWGGWWAWDPVENVALIPWLLLLAAVHGVRGSSLSEWALALTWPAVFAGTAATRTSLRTSVHSFANADGLGWALWPLAAAAGVVAIVLATRNTTRREYRSVPQIVPTIVLLATAVVVALGTFRPFLDGATLGTFYARYLYPVAIVGLVGLGIAPSWRGPDHDRAVGGAALGALLGVLAAATAWESLWWQLVFGAAVGAALGGTVAGSRGSVRRVLAHLGVTAVLIGALGATASAQQTIGVAAGGTVEVAGHRIENLGAGLLEEDPPVIGARIRVDDDTVLEPSLTVYVERRLRLPEVATSRTLLEDVQVVLRSADDDGSAVVTVNAQPLTQFVWIGATLIVASMAIPRVRRRPRVLQPTGL